MTHIFGGDTYLFKKYVEGREKRVFPWQLSIVDCYFIWKAFESNSASVGPVKLTRFSDDGRHVEDALIRDAYDLYDLDRDSDSYEVVVAQGESGASCYWDLHERFVVITGPEGFLRTACPFPEDIEMHRYIEAMVSLEEGANGERPEQFYDALKHA